MNSFMDKLNNRLVDSLHENYPIGAAQGKMSVIIYFYHLYRSCGEERYREIAESFLDQLMEKDLSNQLSLDVEEGLCGVALGLDWLIRERFVAGDINALAADIDALLFKATVFGRLEEKYTVSQMIHFLYYIAIRLREQTSADDRYVYQELAIKLVNKLGDLVDPGFYREYYSFSVYHYHVPLLLKTLAIVARQGFYTGRIEKLLERFSRDLFAHRPKFQLNRLYLLWGVLAVNVEFQFPEWKRYADSLYRSIDLDRLLNEEVKDRNIYISDGLSFFYWIVESLRKDYPDLAFDYSPRLVYDRLVHSDAWNALERDPFYFQIHRGLLNGFPGVVLTMLNLSNKYLCE